MTECGKSAGVPLLLMNIGLTAQWSLFPLCGSISPKELCSPPPPPTLNYFLHVATFHIANQNYFFCQGYAFNMHDFSFHISSTSRINHQLYVCVWFGSDNQVVDTCILSFIQLIRTCFKNRNKKSFIFAYRTICSRSIHTIVLSDPSGRLVSNRSNNFCCTNRCCY